MTLIAVWKTADKIQIASDSRLTVGTDHVDTSIKVTSFPVRVLHPSSAGLDRDQVAWECDIGFCAAGDIAPTGAIKESLRALMDRLWIVPGIGELSMSLFANIVAEMLERLWYAAAGALGNDTSALVVIAGFCPQRMAERAFTMRTDATVYPAKVVADEITDWSCAHFFGSGGRSARCVAKARPQLTPIEVIEAVVQRQLDPHVGGRVQFGKLEGNRFRVYAVLDLDVDIDERTFSSSYYVGGIELMNPEALLLPEGVQLLPRAIVPFEELRARLQSEGFVSADTRPPGMVLFDGARARELHRLRQRGYLS